MLRLTRKYSDSLPSQINANILRSNPPCSRDGLAPIPTGRLTWPCFFLSSFVLLF
jgi:hypothetical protein